MAGQRRADGDGYEPRGGKKAAEKRYGGGHDVGQIADWLQADPTVVLQLIEMLSRNDGAVRFGYTRDGGAYALGIYGGGAPYTIYCKPKEDVNEWLAGICREASEG